METQVQLAQYIITQQMRKAKINQFTPKQIHKLLISLRNHCPQSAVYKVIENNHSKCNRLLCENNADVCI